MDDYAKIIIRFQDGLTAQVESTTFSPYPMPKWWILGNRGSIYVEDCCGESGKARFIAKSHTEDTDILFYPGGSLAHRSMDNFQVDDWEEVVLPEHPVPQDWAALYKNLAAHLDGKEDLVVTPESVLRCFRVIEADWLWNSDIQTKRLLYLFQTERRGSPFSMYFHAAFIYHLRLVSFSPSKSNTTFPSKSVRQYGTPDAVKSAIVSLCG